MEDVIAIFFAVSIGLVFGGLIGHSGGRDDIAKECERLGSFYVGDKVFECKVKGK